MDEFLEAVEIIPGRYYLVETRSPDAVARSATAASNLAYCIDATLMYEPFYTDFGPLNLGRTYRFCEITSRLLQEAEQRGKRLYLYCGPQPQQRANAAVLVGAFQVLLLGRSADAAHAPLAALKPFMPFRDASCGTPCFNLQVIDCLRGLERAAAAGFLDARGGAWRFDIDEYEHYEQVENGDLNWIVPGKLAAFSGPAATPNAYVGFRAMVPEDYWDYYHRRRVGAVVRLNKKVYDRRRFIDGGLRHHEMYFPDGSCPPTDLLLRFLEVAEQEPGALAIHCKAGLGRTGVLICAYIMKHYGFTAEEVIGYIRICRPGSVIGPQQNYIQQIQHLMWREGDAWRAAHGPRPPALAWGPAAPSRAGSMRVAAAGDVATAAAARPAAAAAAAAAAAVSPGPPFGDKRAAAPAVSVMVDATGAAGDSFLSRSGSSSASSARASVSSGGGGGGGAAAPAGGAGARGLFAAPRASGDLSLMAYVQELSMQHNQQQQHHSHHQQHQQQHYSPAPAAAPPRHVGIGRSASGGGGGGSVAAAAAAYLGSSARSSTSSSGGGGGALSSSGAGASRGRSSTPTRGASPSSAPAGGRGAYGGGAFSSLFSVLGASVQGSLASALAAGRQPAAQAAAPRAPSTVGAPGARGRAPSAPRERAGAAGGLRSAAGGDARGRGAGDDAHLMSSSADVFSSAWRTSITASSAAQGLSVPVPGARPASTVVRVLAPNGQPRKVPAAMLQAPGGGGGQAAGAYGSKGPGALMSSSLNGRQGGYYAQR